MHCCKFLFGYGIGLVYNGRGLSWHCSGHVSTKESSRSARDAVHVVHLHCHIQTLFICVHSTLPLPPIIKTPDSAYACLVYTTLFTSNLPCLHNCTSSLEADLHSTSEQQSTFSFRQLTGHSLGSAPQSSGYLQTGSHHQARSAQQ